MNGTAVCEEALGEVGIAEPVGDDSMNGAVGEETLDGEAGEVGNAATVPTPREPVGDDSMNGAVDEEALAEEAVEEAIPSAATAPDEEPSRVDTRPASDVNEGAAMENPTRGVHESEGGSASATMARIVVSPPGKVNKDIWRLRPAF
ncbi:hypothetical protein V7S43_003514 [Phytophthora oleae]|uniref:Uncharacterized protein n=1 Tax=Phytophthora oleae TaxID=2107226 RepID=A0ABD3FXF3_9STRA